MPNDLETKQLTAVLKNADPYAFSILRFPLALTVRKKEQYRVQKDFV